MERGARSTTSSATTSVEGMDLLPSNIDLSAAEVQLVNEVGREQVLGRALKPVLDRYDFILIDCQPSLGLLTINALACADAHPHPAGLRVLRAPRRGAADGHRSTRCTTGSTPTCRSIGILATMFDPRTLHAREVRQASSRRSATWSSTR